MNFVKTRIQNLYRYAPNGVYYCRVRDGNRKEVWKSLETDKESVARVLLPDAIAEIRHKSGRRDGKMTLGECADIYLKRIQSDSSLKPRSVEHRETSVKMLRRTWPGFDDTAVAKATVLDCKDWALNVRRLNGQQYSATKFNSMVESLRGIFEIAVEAELIARNPAMKVDRKGVKAAKRNLPPMDLFNAVLKRLDSLPERKYAALSIRGFAFTGLRPNEAKHVAADDIDLKQKTLVARTTKNGKERTIFLISQAVALFKNHQAEVLVAFKKSPRKALMTVCRELGIARLTPYDMRRMFTTRMMECEVNVKVASETLGHQDKGRTMLAHYVHPDAEFMRREMRKVRI